MRIDNINIDDLEVNRANDRHGELENETAAIAELFRLRENHMRNLAKDITDVGRLYEPPLVWTGEHENVVYDGNRRVTCLKLIRHPERAPNQDLQNFFRNLQEQWEEFPEAVECEIEDDRDVIDEILFRRHTGSQGGVGQSTWDDRAKRNFVERSGKGGKVDIADEIERILAENDALPEQQIPRSTLNRLLSSEINRNRVGVSLVRNQFALTHQLEAVVPAVARIARDLAAREVVLGDLWDNEGKRAYLNRLENDQLLPTEDTLLPQNQRENRPRRRRPQTGGARGSRVQNVLIPDNVPQPPWNADQGRIRAVWDELRVLSLNNHPNAVSALLRILVELASTNYLERHDIRVRNELSSNFRLVYESLRDRDILEPEYMQELARMRQDELISIRSMQRFVHSQHFAPVRSELQTYWTRLGHYLIQAISN